ncbi:phenylalanine--tRNA ligase subunit alpha [Candidatus Pacearchaeota archaeon]|nr:phenylalanine--tRNA ligase subunit alpha [Candidatus Pacearchaeota archaeon]
MKNNSNNLEEIIEKLSPLERKILPFLKLPMKEIKEKSGLDKTSLIRALKFLENKEILKIKEEKEKIINLGTNGIYYKKNNLPERTLLHMMEKNQTIPITEVKKISKLSDNEFSVSLGVLKSKAMVEIKENNVVLTAKKEEITKKMPEEKFLELLPAEESSLDAEQKFAFNNLKKRKEIIEIKENKTFGFELTPLGKELAGKEISIELIEEVTPEIIKEWNKTKKFRKYDLNSETPKIFGGRKHFVNSIVEKTRRIWLDLGFEEMSGTIAQTSFWVFDALFTPQDHPARELQDTFFIKNAEGKIDKKISSKVKESHEKGVDKSKGWKYDWKEKIAKTIVLRTHTTCLSAQKISQLKKTDLPKKYFAIGKVFRNETMDASHLFEFYQTEGIVIDKNANFQHLLGYLEVFLKKLGFKKIRFRPHFFPYTEPSVEADVFNEETGKWIEILGAGIFRPEVVIPLYGEFVPVLAWGMGLDRLAAQKLEIKDIRKIYSNDLSDLRYKKIPI